VCVRVCVCVCMCDKIIKKTKISTLYFNRSRRAERTTNVSVHF